MMSNIHSFPESKPLNRAPLSTAGMVKWVEPASEDLLEVDVVVPQVRNKREYFDDLQRAVAGITALMKSEMSAAEILKLAAMEVKKIETESYEVVREFLGEDVTNQMKRINADLDELAALVSGIEASLAGFAPLMDEDRERERENGRAAA